jgi:hypothetical protein
MIPGSPPTASPANSLATFNIKDHADFAEQNPRTHPLNDLSRGITRGPNHSTLEATRETKGEQKAVVERWKASAIMGSTGLRRRERRFESCRGHHCDVAGHRAQVSRDIVHGWVWGW